MPSGDQLLTGSKTESVAALAGDADLPTVVQAVNGILAALQARGVTK